MNINPINLNLKLVGTKFDNSIARAFPHQIRKSQLIK